MARRLRIQYPDAIYHVMARGNGRQDIVRDDADRERLVEGLRQTVVRCSWRVYAFVIMSNHFHLVLKTPMPNLPEECRASLGIRQRVGSTPSVQRACFPGPVSDRVGGRRDVSLDGYTVRASEPCPCPFGRTPG